MDFFTGIENTAFAIWLAESGWAYPIVLTTHAIGMALLVGVALMVSIRALGYPSAIPIIALDKLVPLAWAGLALNFVSGILLFMPTAVMFIQNRAFQVKIILVIAAGISFWLLLRNVMKEDLGAGGSSTALNIKIIAAFSLIFWLGVIIAGRLIAYI